MDGFTEIGGKYSFDASEFLNAFDLMAGAQLLHVKLSEQAIDKSQEQTKELEDQAKETKKLSGEVKDLIGDYKIFGVSINDISEKYDTNKKKILDTVSAIKLIVTGQKAAAVSTGVWSNSLKFLRLAIIGTGLGAFIIAFGSLLTFLTRTTKGTEALARVMRPIGEIFQTIIGQIENLGEGLFDFLTSGDSVEKKFVDIGQAILDNITNRFIAIPKIGSQVFSILGDIVKGFAEKAKVDLAKLPILGNFLDVSESEEKIKKSQENIIEGFKELSALTGQAITGIDSERIKDIAVQTVEIIKEASARGSSLAALQAQIARGRIDLIKTEGQIIQEIKENKKIVEDTTNSLKDRESASVKATEAADRLAQARARQANLELRYLNLSAEANATSLDGLEEIANKERELIDIENERIDLQTELGVKLNELRAQDKAAREEAQKQIDEFKAAFDELLFAASISENINPLEALGRDFERNIVILRAEQAEFLKMAIAAGATEEQILKINNAFDVLAKKISEDFRRNAFEGFERLPTLEIETDVKIEDVGETFRKAIQKLGTFDDPTSERVLSNYLEGLGAFSADEISKYLDGVFGDPFEIRLKPKYVVEDDPEGDALTGLQKIIDELDLDFEKVFTEVLPKTLDFIGEITEFQLEELDKLIDAQQDRLDGLSEDLEYNQELNRRGLENNLSDIQSNFDRQIEIQDDYLQKKEKLEKRAAIAKQLSEGISTAASLTSSFASVFSAVGITGPFAPIIAAGIISALLALLKSSVKKGLSSFWDGTEGRLKDEDLSPMSVGRDGYVVNADGSEAIFKGSDVNEMEKSMGSKFSNRGYLDYVKDLENKRYLNTSKESLMIQYNYQNQDNEYIEMSYNELVKISKTNSAILELTGVTTIQNEDGSFTFISSDKKTVRNIQFSN